MTAAGAATGAGGVTVALFLAQPAAAEGPPAIGEPGANEKLPGVVDAPLLPVAAVARAAFETPTGVAGEKRNDEASAAEAAAWKGAVGLARPVGSDFVGTPCACVGEMASAGANRNGGLAVGMVIGEAMSNENIPTEPAGPARPAAAFDTPSSSRAASGTVVVTVDAAWAPAGMALANEMASTPTKAGGTATAAALETPSFFAGDMLNGLENVALVAARARVVANGGVGKELDGLDGLDGTTPTGAPNTIAGVPGVVATRGAADACAKKLP